MKYIQTYLFLALIGFLSLVSSPLFAQEKSEPDHYVTFRVLAEKTTVQPGEVIWVAVEQSIYPHWHTYWRNPGDSGSAPKNDWILPKGFSISEIQWPVPKKIPYPPLLNYGYEDSVMLLQKLFVPEKLPSGPITLTVDTEALVCKEICIPEFGTYSLTLNDPDIPSENNQDYFKRAIMQLPQKADFKAEFSQNNGIFELSAIAPDSMLTTIGQNVIEFLPIDWGLVQNASPAELQIEDHNIRVSQKAGDRNIDSLKSISGLFAYTNENGERRGFKFSASKVMDASSDLIDKEGEAEASPILAEKDKVAQTGLFLAILMAVVGGLILNLMPCVFPVLSLKALSLVKTAEKDGAAAKMHGLAYTAGIIISFLAIAGVLIALQAGGQQIGWGFQLQSPIVIGFLAYLLFIIGLNLSGFFEFGNAFGNVGNKLTQGHGLSSSFFTGVLATIVATPCTAPFMGVAIGYALLQPPIVSLSIFAALGFGLALPYLLLSFIPALQKSLPKPGAWMDVFKQLLSFPMFGFAAWLVWILAIQAGTFGVFSILLGMIFLAFALWLLKVRPFTGRWRVICLILAILSALIAFAFIPRTQAPAVTGSSAIEQQVEKSEFGQKFSQEKLNGLLQGSDPVFVEMTAAWCITCKVNHASSINIQSTKDLFANNNVQYLIGDWTNQDAEITEYLNEFGRNGVPIYVFYASPDESGVRPDPVVLPQILTPAIVTNTITGTN